MKTLNRIIGGLALVGVGFIGIDLVRTGLIKNDFNESRPLPYHNENTEIWSSYSGENIPHSSKYWKIYQERVKKMNGGKLRGEILLPDLDGNGKVGK